MTANWVETGINNQVRPISEVGFDPVVKRVKMAERGRTWSDSEIARLLDVWSDGTIQAQLLGAVRNEVPFRKIATELRKAGYDRTFKQCRDKVKALRRRYREIVDKLWRSGAGVESDDEVTIADFPWFQEMHRVLKHRAVTNPPNVIDSATSGPSNPSSSRVDVEEGEESGEEHDSGSTAPNPTPSRSRTPTAADSRTPTPSNSRSTTPTTDRTATVNDNTATPTDNTATPTDSTATPTDRTAQPPKKKRKKMTKMDKADKATNEMVEKILKHQMEQRQAFDDMERQRMKLEEEKATRESERDERFMTLLGQLVAMVRPPQPQPMAFPVQPVPLPPTRLPPPGPSPQVELPGPSPYGSMYSFQCIEDKEDSDD